jgi:hypothetical protein
MLQVAKRKWNPIRFLRRKENVQADSGYEEETAEEDELESRVHQWLKGSKTPSKGNDTRKQEPMQEDGFESILQTDSHSPQSVRALDDTLYHPDFADWASVRLVEPQELSFTADQTQSPFKVFDEATATISNLLKLPFDHHG